MSTQFICPILRKPNLKTDRVTQTPDNMLRSWNIITFLRQSPLLAHNARQMSMYAPTYQEPVPKKDVQAKMKEGDEFKKIALSPIKAAYTFHSSSLFYDPLINKFIGYIMEGGRKGLATHLIDRGLEKVKRIQLERYHLASSDEERAEIELNARVLLHRAIENCRPLMKLKTMKRGGTNYQVPTPLNEKQSYMFAMQWLRDGIRDKGSRVHFPDQFAVEVLDAAHEKGRIYNRKIELHKQCEANRAYAHYRWLKR